MCGGSKGQSTTNQAQTQTYTPSPQAIGAITSALGQAQNTASLPFNIPVAPVAGFSADQQQAFQNVRNAQGMALPYFNQANNYFQQSAQGPNVAQFFNPFASAVTSQLNNIFGQQNTQNTANLVQSAGGVGADRIAVGQANMANQQGLAAGQTLASLYQPALSAAEQEQNILQSAGYGTAALGSAAQNSVLQGAQAQLGTGGLQQQLTQAQLNAPYQQQVAAAAFPYQQSNFYTNAVASLAPGLGGTTAGYGTGTSTPAQPSIWSQILGGAGVGTALLGASGAFGGSGSAYNPFASLPAYGGGNAFTDAYGGSAASPLPGLTAADYGAGYARGGSANPYAIDLPQRADGSYGYDDGGTVSDEPIDISGGFIPQGQTAHIAPHVPQLNLSQPQQQQQSGGSGLGDILKAGAQIATLFAKDGGAIPSARAMKFDGANPYAFAAGGDTDVINPDEPFRMPDQAAVDDWRAGTDSAMAFAPTTQRTSPYALRPTVSDAGPAAPAAVAPQALSGPSAATASAPETAPAGDGSFAASPWAALLSAGLGMMAGTSPFAGVNIGHGGLQGLKTLEEQRAAAQKDTTIEQAAKRLEQEAKFHEDQYSRMTPYQQANLDIVRQKEALEAAKPFKIATDKNGFDVMAVRDPAHPGKFINAVTGEPVTPNDLNPTNSGTFRLPNGDKISSSADGVIPANAQLVSGGSYDYTADAPYIEKGMDVPEPAGIAGHSSRALQTDAEYYLQTGKLPPVARGKSPVAIAQNNYRNAVQNYAGAMAQSRGLSPEQAADMWRTAPGMLRFVLGADGRSTVALGTAVRHLDTLQQYADAWKAGDTRAINRLRAVISREFGDDAATNLEAASRIVGPEIIKAIGVAGAGTADERSHAAEGFSTAASPEQMSGAIKATQALLGGQLEGRKRQAMNAGVSEERFKSLVGDRPYELLTHIDKSAPGGGEKPKPTQADIDYAKAHPEVRSKFIARFGVEP